MLGESFNYAKEAVAGKYVRWILLIISCIIFPLILGYIVEIFKGKKPAPELEHWGKLFINGILYIIIGFIYYIAFIIVAFIISALMFGTSIGAMLTFQNTAALLAGGAVAIIGIIILVIIWIATMLLLAFALIRFAREEKIEEAFNIKEIMAHIQKIGWFNYFIAVLIMLIVLGIIIMILMGLTMLIPPIGMILLLILVPILSIWEARYLTLIYESA